jgi:hypothetical protein
LRVPIKIGTKQSTSFLEDCRATLCVARNDNQWFLCLSGHLFKNKSKVSVQELKMHNTRVLERLRIDSPLRKGHRPHEYRLFQKGRYDFEILTPSKLLEKLGYMHKNPVRAGLVAHIEDYRFSSARNYVLGDDSVISLDSLPI